MIQDNPIYQRLTKDSNGPRAQISRRLALGVPIGVFMAMWLCTSQSQYDPVLSTLVGLLYVVFVSSLVALPAAASSASATAIQREVQMEDFQLVQLTTLTSRDIARGFVEGMIVRLRPFRFASNSLMILILISSLVGARLQIRYIPTTTASLFSPFLIIYVLAIWLNDRLMTSAISAGVLLGVRFQRWPIGSASTPAGFVVGLFFLIGVFVSIGPLLLGGSFGGSLVWLCALATIYFLIAIAGTPLMMAGIVGILDRTRT